MLNDTHMHFGRLAFGTVYFWGTLIGAELEVFGTGYVAAYVVVGAFVAYTRYLMRTGYRPGGAFA